LVTEPDSKDVKRHSDQWLNVRIEGRIALPNEAKSQDRAAGSEDAESAAHHAPSKIERAIKVCDRYANLIVALATVALFAVTFGQCSLSEQIARVSERQYRETERPWVGVAGTEPERVNETSMNIVANFTFANGGKSPAAQVWLRDFALTPLDSTSYLRAMKSCEGKPTNAGVGALLLPGSKREIAIPSDRLQPDTVEYILEQTAQKGKPTIPLNLHPEGIIFIGCLDYMWDNRCYRTRFCEQYVATAKPTQPYGYFGYCNFSNDADENDDCNGKQ